MSITGSTAKMSRKIFVIIALATHATTPNIVGVTMLGVVASVCTQPKGFLFTSYFSDVVVFFRIFTSYIVFDDD